MIYHTTARAIINGCTTSEIATPHNSPLKICRRILSYLLCLLGSLWVWWLAPFQRPLWCGIASLEDVASPSSPIPHCHMSPSYHPQHIINITTIIAVITVSSLKKLLRTLCGCTIVGIKQTIIYCCFLHMEESQPRFTRWIPPRRIIASGTQRWNKIPKQWML